MAAACGVEVRDEVARFITDAVGQHGDASTLPINNAGIQTWSSLLDLDEERWDDVIHTNPNGCFPKARIGARAPIAAGRGGTILDIGSGCTKLAVPNLVDHTASKGDIEQFTRFTTIEPGGHSILGNGVTPGAIATQQTVQEAPDAHASRAPTTSMGRVGISEVVAGVVPFFAGPGERCVTGRTLWVNRGAFSRATWPCH